MGEPASSSTSSRTSRKSSTSKAARLVGHVRLTHPFPSILDGLVAGAAAWFAGGGGEMALRVGLSMVLLQASVGALNDLIDAPRDAGNKPGKPIPAGLVERRSARVIAVVAGVAGVALAVPSGPATVVLALALLGLGYAYDLWFKGTAWSWLPFAVAIPLFPTYGWLGAAGTLPAIWGVLLPLAVVAGAALAIGNAAVDLERDAVAGIDSVALRLGRARSSRLNLWLLAGAAGMAVVSLVVAGSTLPWGVAALGGSVAAAGGAMLVGHAEPGRRERGWELEAVGVAVAAAAWLGGMHAAGLTVS
jgi:4-hydroxybenzoate polyprenyltransferase